VLSDGDFTRAVFTDASLTEARANGAKLGAATLHKTDLTKANLSNAELSQADMRRARLTGAILNGACLTGAKVAGLVGTGAPLVDVQAAFLDASPEGDDAARVSDGEVAFLLSGFRSGEIRPSSAKLRRYFGQGDVLRDARLEFDEGARVEIDSLFENCSIRLGKGTELVVGRSGILSHCEIAGGGDITVHGQFFERASPGILGARILRVTSRGAMVASVEQTDTPTQFAFERGCRLRVKILKPNGAEARKGG
jgi:uncharacterized protein YjbI with pentapeptide repeats